MQRRNVVTIAVALIAASTLTLGGCSADAPVLVESAGTTAASNLNSTPTPTPTVEGTREKPVPAGGAAKHSDASIWTFTVGTTDPDGGPEVMAENPYNRITEGNAMVLAPVHIVVDEGSDVPDGASPWSSFDVSYVSASGNSYSECDVVLPAPGSVLDLGAMYAGAQADFLACASVPSTDVPGGTWRVTSRVDNSYSVYFAGA